MALAKKKGKKMTLKEIKTKIYALLDTSEGDELLSNALAPAIDSAAKKTALYTRCMKKRATLQFLSENGKASASLPNDMASFCYIEAGRERYGREYFDIIDGKIYSKAFGAGVFELVYAAFPPTIDAGTDDKTELALGEYACDIVCYGAAMELCSCVHPNDAQRYMRLATEYDERMANLLTAASECRSVANKFFGGDII